MNEGHNRPFKEVVLEMVMNGGDNPLLTMRQHAVLFALEDAKSENECTIRYLAAKLNVGKPAITRAVDTLVRFEKVKRRRDPKDGRNVFIDLIPADKLFDGDNVAEAPLQSVAAM